MKKFLLFTLLSFIIVGGCFVPFSILGNGSIAYADVGPLDAFAGVLGAKTFFSLFSMTDIGSKTIAKGAAFVGEFILAYVGTTLLIAGELLDKTIEITIFGMGDMIRNMTSITAGWTAVRDIINMFFIFGFLYVAISTILGVGESNAKKFLVNLIIAALLINFSLFFTKVIIDGSNLITMKFYEGIDGVYRSENGGDNVPLSIQLMDPLRLTTVYSEIKEGRNTAAFSADNAQNTNEKLKEIAWVTVLGSIFILIAAFIFFAAAVLLIVRFVTLLILLMLSPVAFLGMVVPGFSKYSTKWREKLFEQVFFAPVFMLMLAISIKIVNDDNFIKPLFKENAFAQQQNVSTFANAFTGNGSTAIIFNFVVVIGFFVASLVFAKSMGVAGATGLLNFLDGRRKWAQGFIGRSIVRGPRDFGIRKLDEKFGETKFGNTMFGDALRRSTTGLAVNAKFGSEESAEESYKRSKELRSNREEIGIRNEVIHLAESGASSDIIQRKLGRLSPEYIAKLPTHLLEDPKFMANLSYGHLKALDHSDERTREEKDKFIKAHMSQYTEKFIILEKKLDEYDKKVSEFVRNFNTSTGRPPTALAVKTALGEKPSMSSLFPDLHRKIRETNPALVDMFNQVDEKFFTYKGVSSFKQIWVDTARKSESWGQDAITAYRNKKVYDFIDATDHYYGIDLTIDEKTKTKMEDFARKKWVEEGKDVYDFINQTFTDEQGRTVRYEPDLFRPLYEDAMEEARRGKSDEEIQKMKGSKARNRPVMLTLSMSDRPFIAPRDDGDKKEIVNHLLFEEYKETSTANTENPYHMTPGNRQFLDALRDPRDRHSRAIVKLGYSVNYVDNTGTHALVI